MSSDDQKPTQRFNSTKPKRPDPLLNQDLSSTLVDGTYKQASYHVKEVKIPKLPTKSEGQSPTRNMLNKSPSRSLIKAVFNAYNPGHKKQENGGDGAFTGREEDKKRDKKKSIVQVVHNQKINFEMQKGMTEV